MKQDDEDDINGRLSLMYIRFCNRAFTTVNFHASTNDKKKKDLEAVEYNLRILEETLDKVSQHHTIILMCDFHAKIDKEQNYRRIVGYYPVHKGTNMNEECSIDVCEK